MKKTSLILSLLAFALAASPALTSCKSDTIYEQQAKLVEAQKKTDDATIQAYLSRHTITNYTRLESGVYLVPVTDGPASNPLIKAGQKVTTNYVGKFIDETNDGVVFDASSSNRTACGCFSFYNGSNGAIEGWTKATLQMRKGDRKLVLIPSYLAYGTSGYGTISGNTPLLFDLEILNVE
ncbi:FKBP-type peptidyl-prolyl cis-trans isomerase [Hymenobacter rigui]|uniref:Peptidyl-prolyl cis-trans isomerase n=1 Tax=Hymenobacter rigui TaxID=334424 RepID=A0A3R9MJG4_9BACT|nr:FKBP-type peptidyl-prolyl cis-trans isomerase [Hymenobacter rigui]RSK47305.1 FKBP-type peptidyl-prolyl cis-trans isomerase [Hymenobacter rigui]